MEEEEEEEVVAGMLLYEGMGHMWSCDCLEEKREGLKYDYDTIAEPS